MTERMNLNMEDLEMVTGGADRLKCGNEKNASNDERKIRS
jgi:predicted DNA-binding protein